VCLCYFYLFSFFFFFCPLFCAIPHRVLPSMEKGLCLCACGIVRADSFTSIFFAHNNNLKIMLSALIEKITLVLPYFSIEHYEKKFDLISKFAEEKYHRSMKKIGKPHYYNLC
jgi:hypothetical protein